MKLYLNLSGSVPLSNAGLHDGEDRVLAALRKFAKKLGLSGRFVPTGAGTDFVRRDASAYVEVKESELKKLAKKMPAKKYLNLNKVRIDVQYANLELDVDGLETQTFSFKKGELVAGH